MAGVHRRYGFASVLFDDDPTIDRVRKGGVVRYKDDRPGVVLRAEPAKQDLPHRGQHVMEGTVEDQQLRARHDRPGHQETKSLTEGKVGIQVGHRCGQPLWQRIDVLVEFDEMQGPLKILVGRPSVTLSSNVPFSKVGWESRTSPRTRLIDSRLTSIRFMSLYRTNPVVGG